jgi:putative transposase
LKPSRKRILIDGLLDRYRASLTQTCALFKSALRLSAGACDVEAGRLARQPQTRLPAVSGRRPVLRLKRPKRNKSARLRQPKHLVTAMNQIWSMDFVADALFDGRRLRALTVVDNYTRESLAIDVGQSLKGEDVVNTLNRIVAERGLPTTIKTDNGSEFISKVMDEWAYERGVEIDFSRPGKPTDNAKVESFNGRLRQECLNEHWFLSLDDAKTKIEAWRQHYAPQEVPLGDNETRPHSALQWATPTEFARQAREKALYGTATEPEISTFARD